MYEDNYTGREENPEYTAHAENSAAGQERDPFETEGAGAGFENRAQYAQDGRTGQTQQEGPTGYGSYQYSRAQYQGPQYGQSQYRSDAYGSYQGYQGNPGGQTRNGKAKKGSFLKTLGVIVAIAVVVGGLFGAGLYGISRYAQGRIQSSDGTRSFSWSFGGSKGDSLGESFEEFFGGSDEEDAKEAKEDKDRLTLQQTGKDEKTEDAASEDTEEKDRQTIEIRQATAVVTDVTEVAENVMPSVVSVFNNYTATQRDWWGQTYYQDATSTGSGIIIAKTDDELLIATNNHVVEGEDSLEVQFINNSTASAEMKGTDADNDLAVIAVDLEDIDEETLEAIKVATLGVSSELKIGEPAIAIGNALGYGQSVTTGVISALEREISVEGTTGTFIQTDAAINPGNSGGALVNIAGEVIGINSNKIGGSAVEGMGYAIPIDRAVPIIEELMNRETRAHYSEDEQGYLGINGVSVTEQVAKAYNMPEGAYIAEVIRGSAAESAKLRKGDIITKIDGTEVGGMDAVKEQMSYHRAGETVTVTVQRMSGDGEYEELEVEVTLGDRNTVG